MTSLPLEPAMTKNDRERSLAMFVDLENLAMGFQNQRKTKFDITKVLERMVEKGKLIVKKAYADWSRYQAYTAPFHEAAIELIEIPEEEPDRQELGRYPPRGRRDGPRLEQAPRRHLRHCFGRFRLLAARLEA